MKKIISLIIVCFMLVTFIPSVAAVDLSWQDAFRTVIESSASTEFMLMDVSNNGIPELFCSGDKGVKVYYYEEQGAVLASDDRDIPYDFVTKLVSIRDTKTDDERYMGQIVRGDKLITFKMSFSACVPTLEVIAEENLETGEGFFKGSGSTLEPCDNAAELVTAYLENYAVEYILKTQIRADDVYKYGKKQVTEEMFSRYAVLSGFSDDTPLFSAQQREDIKKNVGKGKFSAFSKLSMLSDNVVFVEYFADDAEASEYAFPYNRKFALLSDEFEVIKSYDSEWELDAEYLSSLLSDENQPSNFNPDYNKAETFRGIDDYVSYFSALLSDGQQINENGKKDIAAFLEYTVNRCSRSEIKSNNNVFTVKKSVTSIIARNASDGMDRLRAICDSKGVALLRAAKTVPELVCKGADLTKPVRIEFDKGVAASISDASGLRIMLDDKHGIYVNSAELSVLESEVDIFAIEYKKTEKDYSIVFTGKDNREISSISMPVWVIVPAKSDFSSVSATFDGGTENRGGRYDDLYKTIEFSVTRSGNYQVVEEDVTINDMEDVSISANQAIRFLVSKGIMEVDRSNNFYPEAEFSRYDFTKALVNMFYTENKDAKCSYPDVLPDNEYYKYIATAEAMDITKPVADGTFSGDMPTTNEYMLLLCGKILAEKKGYKFPDNYVEHLAFSDKSDITPGAMPYVAVAVQCGLAQNAGKFMPAKAVTREEGAYILYKTFSLLYDTSPVTTSFSAMADNGSASDVTTDLGALPRLAICVLFTVVCALGIFLLWKLNNRKKEENEEKEEPKTSEE